MGSKRKKIILSICIPILVVLFLVALPIVALRIALTQSVSNKLLGMLPDYMQAEASIKNIDYSIFATWPSMEIQLSDVTIISDVFEPKDTLLHVKHLELSANADDFLSEGKIKINRCILDEPCVYGHSIDNKNNWDVLPPSEPDTSSSTLPDIYFTQIEINKANLKYKDETQKLDIQVLGLSLQVHEGAYTPDSLAAKLAMSIESIIYNDNSINRKAEIAPFTVNATASQTTNIVTVDTKINADNICVDDSLLALKNQKLDIELSANCDPKFKHFNINNLLVNVDKNHLALAGYLGIEDADSSYYTDLKLRFASPYLKELLALTPKPFKKYLKGFNFDGALGIEASSKGYMKGKHYPVIAAHINLDKLHGKFDGFKQSIDDLGFDIKANYNDRRKDSSFVDIKELHFKSGDSNLKTKGRACYKRGKEYVDISLLAHINLHTINNLYKIEENSEMKGNIDADVDTYFLLEDLKNQNLYNIFSKSSITGDGVDVVLPQSGIDLYIDSLRARINTNTGVASRRSGKIDTSLVNTRISFRKMELKYKKGISASANRFSLSFLADDIEDGKPPRLRTSISLRGLQANIFDTIQVTAKRARMSINVRKNENYGFIPNSSIKLSFDSVLGSTPKLGVLLDSTRITLLATPRFRKRKKLADGTRVNIPDSEQKIIDMKAMSALLDTISKAEEPAELYMKKFSNNGDIYIKRFRVKSPDFPLRTSINRVDVDFTDDTLHLDNLRLRIGRSAITLSGELENMRRYLLRGRTLKADLSLKSKRLDINQLLSAFYASNQAQETPQNTNEKAKSVNANLDALNESDESDDNSTKEDSTATAGLIVLPNNIDLKFKAKIDTVKFGKMRLENFKGKVTMRNQSLRIKELFTNTQIGKANMNVMYNCSDPKTATAAASVIMDSVQIGDIVEYIPELDTLMPMLRSFDGNVYCEASGSTKLDSTMSISLPTVNAALLLKGNDVVLMDGETFSEIAKMLMFNKKTKNLIDSVSVELLVRNNEIQIFPFMISLDKYRLGVGGTQNLDMSFNYHIALLKSPLPFMMGVDVYGPNFDKIKYKLVSPKFKDSNVQIGRGGTLINEGSTNIRTVFHKTMLNAILQEQELKEPVRQQKTTTGSKQ
ncbi:MAG: hypothetical protein EOL95_01245 [Bacteroidia bacterium]|nr:hypothetical protein [Bacteroidia bacterium]